LFAWETWPKHLTAVNEISPDSSTQTSSKYVTSCYSQEQRKKECDYLLGVAANSICDEWGVLVLLFWGILFVLFLERCQ